MLALGQRYGMSAETDSGQTAKRKLREDLNIASGSRSRSPRRYKMYKYKKYNIYKYEKV